MKPMPEVSKELGITTDQARYWVQLLEAETEKRGRVVFFPAATIALLAEMARFVAEGFSPGEASRKARGVTVTHPVTLPVNPTDARVDALERAVLMLVEEIRVLKDPYRAWYSQFFQPAPRGDTLRDKYLALGFIQSARHTELLPNTAEQPPELVERK